MVAIFFQPGEKVTMVRICVFVIPATPIFPHLFLKLFYTHLSSLMLLLCIYLVLRRRIHAT